MVGESKRINRAMIFVDGSNFYHGLKHLGARRLGQLDYAKIAKKLIGPRTWVGLRYYVGQVQQSGDGSDYAGQRSFVDRQRALDDRITFYFGRLERRDAPSDAAVELLQYLAALRTKVDSDVFRDLVEIGKRHKTSQVTVEKAVDVMLAVDLVVLAERDQFDTAYILSADGDYTHAAQHVKSAGKKVFAAAGTRGHQLAGVVDHFIEIDLAWISDCYIAPPSIRPRKT